jgi:5'(3')-deoxyribonucleotidase
MKCYVDMDGVIADIVPAWLSYRGLRMPERWPDGNYNLAEIFNIPPALVWRGCDEDWWENLPKTPDADRIIDIVERRFALREIYIVSKPVVNDGATGKLRWLQRHYPRFLGRYLLTPCREVLANAEAVLIDDSSENIDLFNRCGGRGLLLARLWNRRFAKSNQAAEDLECRLAETLGTGLDTIRFS